MRCMSVTLLLDKAGVASAPIGALPFKAWNRATSIGIAGLTVTRLVFPTTKLRRAPIFCQPNLIIMTRQHLSKTQIFYRLAETPNRIQHCHKAD